MGMTPKKRTQTQAELLRVYSESPPGATLWQARRITKISQSTLRRWQLDPVFRAAIKAVEIARAGVDWSHFEQYMRAADKALLDKVVTGDVNAQRLFRELVGQIKPAGVRVDQRVGVVNDNGGGGDDDIAQLLERRNTLAELIRRRRQIDEPPAIDPADPGLALDGGGTPDL